MYHLGNLLQDLARARDAGRAEIHLSNLFADPVTRIERAIRAIYGDELTRRIDAEHLPEILREVKVAQTGRHYLYVPHGDERAYRYFENVAEQRPDLELEVVRLPERITPEYVDGLRGRHGLLSLALEEGPEGGRRGLPFVVPGGRFNEMYGWDSYFMVLGLLEAGRSRWPRAWSTTSSTRSATTARFSTPTGPIT